MGTFQQFSSTEKLVELRAQSVEPLMYAVRVDQINSDHQVFSSNLLRSSSQF